ncbi:hypothetical protein H6CHR_00070 [Variovorax sp. PBL-H6]|uniref:hypothetical protein n=1 Tax=Variovorax sp. PBL-H6 TaxID=434009 RepID=UPI001317EAE5|nr:hypothetical protein [Variovorax sp. PBL-H6]VTU14955.1 hypothetical protein H6CHR_00070 [Variovorax sp. PBL-H6]
MPRHDVLRRAEMRPARREADYERWRDEDDVQRVRPHAGPDGGGEQLQSPGAKPLHRTQQQQH